MRPGRCTASPAAGGPPRTCRCWTRRGRWREEELTVNYRTPSEVMELAAQVLHVIDPALEPPTSVRDSGQRPVAVRADSADALALTVAAATADAMAAAAGGTVGVLTPR